MQSLLELSDILGNDPLPLDPTRREHQLARLLADYLRSAVEPTDAGAAAALGLEPGQAAYRKVKHLLKYAYINGITAVYSHHRRSADRQKVYEYAWKHLSIGLSYRLRPQTQLVVPYLKEALAVAEEHDIPEVAALAARQLAHQYANKQYNKKQYLHYNEVATKFENESTALNTAQTYAGHLVFMRNSNASMDSILMYAKESHEELLELADQTNHGRVRFFAYYILLTGFIAARQYKNAIQVGNNALTFLDSQPTPIPQLYQLIEANMSLAYLQTENYTDGVVFAQRLLEKTSPDSYNYLKAYELMIFLGFRSGNYSSAYLWLQKAKAASISKRLRSTFRETFDILDAHIYLLVEAGVLNLGEEKIEYKKFRITKFLNSFDHADREKSNRNVQILIVKLVHYLLKRKHSKLYDSIDAIEKYLQRHLQSKDNKRSKLFIKALLQLPKRAFHKAAVLRHAEGYIQKMREQPLGDSNQELTAEIIPYEVLWDIITDSLENKRVSKKG